ncbi:MAG: dihydrodipicolinate synthase family protein [Chloroflexota bacterium]|nr:dihydrodipicolinate synthase family protein [Chloroflexota bacterium]|tara:strand:+ start:1323 stop:2228 length:906 start_codon:yes stop_codon:yes gene_type:complete
MNIQNIKSPILVAPSPTPFTSDGKVDYQGLENNATKWLNTELTGFVLGTENGEEQLLNFEEKKDICKTVISVAKEKKLIIAGIDNPSVKGTLEDAESYIRLGVDVLRIRIPRRRDTIDKYFNEVLEKISAPVLIIHQMAPGGFANSMTTEGADPDQIGRFCSHDAVIGYIASHLVRFEMMTRKFVAKSKQFWVPNAMLMAAQILEGANGACFMLGNIAPKLCIKIMKLGLEGNYSESKKLNDSLVDVDWNILSRGAPGLKYAMDLLGYQGGDPRSPLNILDEKAKSEIKKALHISGISKVE